MSGVVLRSDAENNTAALALGGVRARSGVAISFKRGSGAATHLDELHEWGGFRAKLPRTHGLREAVLINTGGGMLGGDTVEFNVRVKAHAQAQITTQSAERVYRSLSPDTSVNIALSVADHARLYWLPQETILFNKAR